MLDTYESSLKSGMTIFCEANHQNIVVFSPLYDLTE